MSYNKDAAGSPARLARGLIGAYNERPHGDSKVSPYSVKARIRVQFDAQCTQAAMASDWGALRKHVCSSGIVEMLRFSAVVVCVPKALAFRC